MAFVLAASAYIERPLELQHVLVLLRVNVLVLRWVCVVGSVGIQGGNTTHREENFQPIEVEAHRDSLLFGSNFRLLNGSNGRAMRSKSRRGTGGLKFLPAPLPGGRGKQLTWAAISQVFAAKSVLFSLLHFFFLKFIPLQRP